jgi:xylose isomerase
MAFALAMGKLWSVHLNDQNGLKFDQDKSFGSVDLRSAFNQVRVLELAQYAKSGRYVGLDVKAMRTQSAELATRHLSNSRKIFLDLVEKYRTFPSENFAEAERTRDYEKLELRVIEHLMGVGGR